MRLEQGPRSKMGMEQRVREALRQSGKKMARTVRAAAFVATSLGIGVTTLPMWAAPVVVLGLMGCETPEEREMETAAKEIIGDKDEYVRSRAVNRLRHFIELGYFARSDISPGAKTSVSVAFSFALSDEAPRVRQSAASALVRLAELDVSPELMIKMTDPLTRALGNEDGSTQMLVVMALVKIVGSKNISPELKVSLEYYFITELEGNSWSLQEQAANKLVELMGSTISPELNGKMVDSLIKALEHKDLSTRLQAVWILEKLAGSTISPELKAKMIDPLVKAGKGEGGNDLDVQGKTAVDVDDLKSKDIAVRSHAARALRELLRSNTIPFELKDKIVDSLIRTKAFEGDRAWIMRSDLIDILSDMISGSNIPPKLKAKVRRLLKNAE